MSENENSGCYQLLIYLERNHKIGIGVRENIHFRRGYYFYTGRARRNLKQRISRHLSKEKKKHWHIDYFLEKSKVIGILSYTGRYDECIINRETCQRVVGEIIPGFGSSDCRCAGHLIYIGEKEPDDYKIVPG